jgi:hypothetical protein
MRIRGITREQAAQAAERVGVELNPDTDEKNGVLRTTIRPDSSLKPAQRAYTRFSANRGLARRRVNAVCWHGHRDWMRELFRINPDAVISSALATYRGVRDFDEKFSATALTSVGQGQTMVDLCECNA